MWRQPAELVADRPTHECPVGTKSSNLVLKKLCESLQLTGERSKIFRGFWVSAVGETQTLTCPSDPEFDTCIHTFTHTFTEMKAPPQEGKTTKKT